MLSPINYPKEETFGLTSQIRQSGSSIPATIAQGCGRGTNPQTNRFFDIAFASLAELQYQFILSRDLNYPDQTTFYELHDEAVGIRKLAIACSRKLMAQSYSFKTSSRISPKFS